ncbi:MAG: hypothetical protein U9R17_02155 [Thermodesulfobacteriota bacterium]|nr:hypothetical protein [Thermodesulfobacteriota bacterium]
MAIGESELLNVYMKEYETIRSEILLRLKEKNTIVRYMILLISAVIAGIWKVNSNLDQTFLMIVLLFIIPFISLLLSFIHNWHDEMIVALSSYFQKEVRLKINSIFHKEDLFGMNKFLSEFRNGFLWKTKAIIMRLIFIAPIPVSVIGYFMIKIVDQKKWIETTLIFIDLLCLLLIIVYFFIIDRKYKKIETL